MRFHYILYTLQGVGVMPGKVIFTIIGLIMATIILLHVYSFFIHMSIKSDINQINYHTVNDIADTGIFTTSAYNELQEEINKLGDYTISLRLDKLVKPNIYDTYFDTTEILDRRLRKGDRITIHLEDKDLTWFGRLVNMSFLNSSSKLYIDNRIRSSKSAPIAVDARDIVKGYEVIVDIKDKSAEDSIAILVKTKMNIIGKYYGSNSHINISTTNLQYGDSLDEQYPAANYIFENGDFIREIEYDAGNSIRLITYVQQ